MVTTASFRGCESITDKGFRGFYGFLQVAERQHDLSSVASAKLLLLVLTEGGHASQRNTCHSSYTSATHSYLVGHVKMKELVAKAPLLCQTDVFIAAFPED